MTECLLKCGALAAQLTREARAIEYTAAQIAADALALLETGLVARSQVDKGKPIRSVARRAQKIASRYGAEVVPSADPHGMALGIRFRGGAYSNGARNVYFIA